MAGKSIKFKFAWTIVGQISQHCNIISGNDLLEKLLIGINNNNNYDHDAALNEKVYFIGLFSFRSTLEKIEY